MIRETVIVMMMMIMMMIEINDIDNDRKLSVKIQSNQRNTMNTMISAIPGQLVLQK